jgi:hypothetical protein
MAMMLVVFFPFGTMLASRHSGVLAVRPILNGKYSRSEKQYLLSRIPGPYLLLGKCSLWHRMVITLLLTTSVLVPMKPVFASPGVPALLEFEDLAHDTQLYNQYDGVVFVGGDLPNSDGSKPITLFQPVLGTLSPTQAVLSNIRRPDECNKEFCGSSLTLQFTEPQRRVRLSTGLAFSYSFAPLTMLMRGYDGDPKDGNSTIVAQSVAECLGTEPTPITSALGIEDAAVRIRYIRLSIVRCSDPYSPALGPTGRPIVLDNLVYDRPLVPVVRESEPPIITVVSPSNGATVTGTTPGSLFVEVKATVTESALASLTAQVNGHAPVPVNYKRLGTQTYSVGTGIDDVDGLVEGANTIVLTAVDFGQPAQSASVSLNFTYQSKPILPPSQVDIWPVAFQVTQGIDVGPHQLWSGYMSGDDTGYFYRAQLPIYGDPTFVTGKDTLIRVYAAATGVTSAVANVPAIAYVKYADCVVDCEPAWGQAIPPIVEPTKVATGGITVEPLDRPGSKPALVVGNLANTWNFLLPAAAVTRDLIVTIYVNQGQYQRFPALASVEECSPETPFTCQYNNRLELRVHFEPRPTIAVSPVYLHVITGANGASVVASEAQVNAIFTLLNKLYPARVVRAQRFDRYVAPTDDDETVLDVIKEFSSSSDQHLFLGIYPGDQGSFAPRYGGLAKRGGRGAWAQANDPFASAHELGHNTGLVHFSCNHREAEGGTCEPKGFDFAHGGIGGFGMDIANWHVILPGDNSSDLTKHAHDFMSYGFTQHTSHTENWVSLLTYERLFAHSGLGGRAVQANSHTLAAQTLGLLVRGSIDETNTAILEAVYRVSNDESDNDGISNDSTGEDGEDLLTYTLEGSDATGNILFVHNFKPQQVMAHGDAAATLDFAEMVPDLANLDVLRLYRGAQIMNGMTRAVGGIGLTIIEPAVDAVWPAGTAQTIRWSHTSPSGAPLFTQIEFSPDGGTHRFVLGRDIVDSTFVVNVDELPGTKRGILYVQVSDGLNIAESAVSVTVDYKAPVVQIMSPQPNASMTVHVPLSLEGNAVDSEEELTDAQLEWSSSQDGELGTGWQLLVDKLSIGRHTLTLTASDSQGKVGQASIEIEVVGIDGIYKSFLPLLQH